MKQELLTIEQLAEFLCMSEKTIRNRMATKKPMPPSFKLPESRVRLWRETDVQEWVNKVADEAIAADMQMKEKLEDMKAIVRRGRPAKKRGGN